MEKNKLKRLSFKVRMQIFLNAPKQLIQKRDFCKIWRKKSSPCAVYCDAKYFRLQLKDRAFEALQNG